MTSVAIVAAPLLLVTYYVMVYFALGTESNPRVLVPQYSAPGGFSPAYLRFVWRGVADARSVAAVFASLCTARLISLQKNCGKYTVRRLYMQTTPLSHLAAEENTVLDFLFSNFYQETTFDPTTQSQGCASVILAKLSKIAGGRYVQYHSGYVALGVLGSCLAGLVLLWTKAGPNRLFDCFVVVVFICCLAPFGLILMQALQSLSRDIRQGTWRGRRIFLALVLLSFFVAWFVLLGAKLRADYHWNTINAIFMMALLNNVAQPLLRRDTEEGKKLKQQIEGFRAFLLAVEQDRLQRMNPPVQEINYATNLAYAVALEVKEA